LRFGVILAPRCYVRVVDTAFISLGKQAKSREGGGRRGFLQMLIFFATYSTVLLIALVAVVWRCGRLKNEVENLRFKLAVESGKVFMLTADEATRRGFGDDPLEEEWADTL
jgi:hypothetical protein